MPPLLCVPVASSATINNASSSRFSDHSSVEFNAGSFPHGAGNSSNIPASISYQPNRALRPTPQRDRTRIRRIAFRARSTRNGYSLPPVNLRQTSAAMFAPDFAGISYPLRRNCGA
jgi:hypothetical protein